MVKQRTLERLQGFRRAATRGDSRYTKEVFKI